MTRHRAQPRSLAGRALSTGAIGAVCAQVSQAGASLVLQLLAARALGLEGFGAFAILYGVIVLMNGLVTGFVGDSLTVLDRHRTTIRSALQGWVLVLSASAGVFGGGIVTLVGLTSLTEGFIFGLACTLFLLEDTLRRLLMARLRFWRIMIVDGVSLLGSIWVLAILSAGGGLTLASFLGALAAGQGLALLVAAGLQHRGDRYVVRFVRGGYRTVAAYGGWRAAQQALRPALLTAVRTSVLAFAGLAATGQLEAARLYAAPTMILVSGLSSFLFSSFARSGDAATPVLLRRADRAVIALVSLSVVVGGGAILALPLLGPMVTGAPLDPWSVVGWVVFSASVAMVTPYGALAAVRGRPAAVFGFRAAESLVGAAAVIVALSAGTSAMFVPFFLAAGSVLGGLGIRRFLLRPRRVTGLPAAVRPEPRPQYPIHA